MRKLTLFITCFFCLQLGAQELNLMKKQMYADFDEMISILQDCNTQLPIRKAVTGIDQLQLAKNLRASIDTITEQGSFFNLLNRVLGCMYDIHTRETDTYSERYDNLRGIDTVEMNHRSKNISAKFPKPRDFFIGNPICVNHEYYIPGLVSMKNMKTQDSVFLYYSKIIAYNDVPYSEYVRQNLSRFPSSGTRWDHDRKKYYANYSLIPYSGMLLIENKGDTLLLDLNQPYGIDIRMFDRINLKPDIPENAFDKEKKVLYFEKDKILYIYLDNMMGDAEEIPQKIKEIGKDKTIAKVIIDVRGNKGGGDYLWHNVLKSIVADSLIYNPVMAFKNSERMRELYDYPNAFSDFTKLEVKTFDWLPGETFLVTNFAPSYFTPDSNSLKYKGKIYILQNEEVYSSGHSLASYAKHIEQLVSVGEPSGLLAGFGLGPRLFQLKHSKFTFRLETEIDVSLAKKPEDVYQNIPEIVIPIPSEKKFEYKKDWGYDQQCEEYLYKYDYLFQKVLEWK